MGYLSRKLYRHGGTVYDGKWGRWSSTPTGEFLVVAIMAPTLVVLVAWLGNVLGLHPVLSQGLAMILALVLVWPAMQNRMLSFTQTETDDTLSMSPTPPAPDAGNSFLTQDSSE